MTVWGGDGEGIAEEKGEENQDSFLFPSPSLFSSPFPCTAFYLCRPMKESESWTIPEH